MGLLFALNKDGKGGDIIDTYIEDLETETKDKLRFPMLPEKINVQTGAVFQSYDIMSIGEVKLPVGESLTVFSWDGILPGEVRKSQPYVKQFNAPKPVEALLKAFGRARGEEDFFIDLASGWRSPKQIQELWSTYRARKKKLRLLITETPINHEVWLESYSVDYKHGYGDYYYQISFIHAKELKIYTENEAQDKGGGNNSAAPLENKSKGSSRTEPPKQTTYTVKSGDTLWLIAQKLLGDGARYKEIHAINQPPLGTNPDKIQPGQVLTIPNS